MVFSKIDNLFVLLVKPALPYDFTLTLGSTELQSGSATFSNSNSGGQYTWSATNPSWTDGQMVGVKLDIGLIDMCGRSSAVAHAIVEATPSFDFCHMTSPLDMDDITELDLPNGRGTGLKVGDFAGLSGLTRLDLSGYGLGGHGWNQLPVGVFDGLGNLKVLRIADAGYQDSGIHLLDKDIFKNLGNLRELDVRPSEPHLFAPLTLMPLTSLTTYKGQPYDRPAEPPENLQYASGRIDHQMGNYKSCYTVTLKWDAPTEVTGITGYRVLRNLGSQSLSSYATQTGTTDANTRFCADGRDADVCSNTSGIAVAYFAVAYFAAAITADGGSFPVKVHVNQTSQTFQTSQVPSTPPLRGSLYDEDYKVRLRWDDPGDPAISGYEISYRPSSSAAWRTIVVNTGNVLLYDYDTQPLEDNSRSLEDAFILNAFRDEGPEHTDSREFRIRALNAAGASGCSNAVRPFQ